MHSEGNTVYLACCKTKQDGNKIDTQF